MNLLRRTKFNPSSKGGAKALRNGRGMSPSLLRRTENSPTKSIRKHLSPSWRGLGGGFTSTLRRFSKPIAAFFIINFLSSLFAPNVAYALTSGPTSPDYTSFEPVDTTDMVNLLSGDLAYNIPLLEVPGPAGGYPLSLSYHAGIMPNEEASWVGLGWTLNPGAINRSVNGFPDDHKNVANTDRFFWEGGERSELQVGVTLGIAGIAGVGAGLSFGTDTYQGFGVGGFITTNAGFGIPGTSVGVGVNSEFGIDPWGNGYGYQSFRTNLNGNIKGLSLNAGASTNFNSVNFSAGVNASFVGASISSGSGVSASIAGVSGRIVNNKVGNLSTSSSGFTLPLPLLHLGFQQTRYWIDEIENINTNGALFYPNTDFDQNWLDENTYDTYYLNENIYEPGYRSVGGSLPNYDNYNVTGQGISGAIRPYKFQQHLVRQNIIRDEEVVQLVTGYDDDQSFQWRFVNDFSNRYEYDPTNFNGNYGKINPSDFNFSSTSIVGESGGASLINGLSGSKRIETYTNAQILNGSLAGFINTKSSGFIRSDLPGDQIGAYVITNESGVTYYYTLPAWTEDGFQYSENLDKSQNEDGLTYNSLNQPEKYAYIWHLTALTGPDFVDRGIIGELDEDDWGYWVEFDYGNWTNNYYWRNPGAGMNRDLDSEFQNFSEGKKQVYYLDAVRTKTHTAFFVKDVRDDAQSAIPILKSENNDGFILNEESRNGGFEEQTITCTCNKTSYASNGGGGITYEDDGTLTYDAKTTLSMRLDKIILVENNNVNLGEPGSVDWYKGYGSQFGRITFSQWEVRKNDNLNLGGQNVENCDFSNFGYSHHNYGTVLDIHDLDHINLDEVALRTIDLNNDNYELVPNTPNSESGKLTLKGIKFLGKEGAELIPETKFDYGNSIKKYTGKLVSSSASSFEAKFEGFTPELNSGDLVKIKQYTFLVLADASGHSVQLKMLGNKILLPKYVNGEWVYFDGEDIVIKKTKNPHHLKSIFGGTSYHDNWQMFKSDFVSANHELGEGYARRTTDLSAMNTDVWSLRSITTSLGAKIKLSYESDDYSKVATLSGSLFTLKDIVHVSGNKFDITINESYDLRDFYNVGQELSITSIFLFDNFNYTNYYIDDSSYPESTYIPNNIKQGQSGLSPIIWECNSKDLVISSVSSNKLTITSSYLNERLVQSKTVNAFDHIVLKSTGVPYATGIPVRIVFNDYPDFFYGGFISSPQSGLSKGGGIRVSSVGIEYENKELRTEYSYESGVTSYLPYEIKPAKKGAGYSTEGDDYLRLIEQNSLYLYSDIQNNSKEIPPPGVLYGKVKVQGFVNGGPIDNYEVFEFETFHAGMVGIHEDFDEEKYVGENNWFYDGKKIEWQHARRVFKKDYSARTGLLKRIILFDQNHRILSQTINHYLHDDIPGLNDLTDGDYFELNVETYESVLSSKYNNQGVIDETFADARLVRHGYEDYRMKGVITKNEHYPSVLTGTTTTNFKTGITQSKKNLAFDFYSGQVTHSYSQDGYGNKYVNKSVPAYQFYPEMISKNMLTQAGTAYSYLMDSEFNPDSFSYGDDIRSKSIGLVGSSAQSWSKYIDVLDGNTRYDDQASDKIYRKQTSYSFVGNSAVNLQPYGTYPVTDFEEVPLGSNYQTLLRDNTEWQRNSQITLYDINSHALEAKDINGNFAATKFDNGNQRVFATAANARYDEFAYSGAEDDLVDIDNVKYFGGGVIKSGGVIIDISEGPVHTGTKSLKSSNSGNPFKYWLPASAAGRTFKASVWTTHPEAKLRYRIDGSTTVTAKPDESKKSGDWYLITLNVPVPDSFSTLEVFTLGVSDAEVYWDDFRVHPVDATMTSYAYNEWGELSDILDANNFYTHYEYDKMGRLKSVTRETFSDGPVKVSDKEIYYKSGRSTSFYGTITTSQIDYNTTRLSIDLSDEGSGDYKVRWDIDGNVSNTNGLNKDITLSNSEQMEIIVTVTDNQTGLSFTDYQKKVITVCSPAGTLMSTRCETNSNGCYTGIMIKRFADGFCGYYEVEEAVFSCIDGNNNLPGCEQ